MGRTLIMLGLSLLSFGLIGLLGLVFIASVLGALFEPGEPRTREALRTERVAGPATARRALLEIDVSGVITGNTEFGSGGLFSLSEAPGYAIKYQLEAAARDASIDGVMLVMNTPGGTVYGSKAIADGVRAYREATGKPVVAFVAGMSASGGMYAMAPASEIIADAGTLVGSIGVIAGPFATYNRVTATDGGLLGGGVTTRDGIDYTVFSQGRSKDFGSPYRRMTASERRVFTRQLAATYDQFVRHIATSREIPAAQVRARIGAMVYGPSDAQRLRLIDRQADRNAAQERLANLAGLEGVDYQLLRADQSSGGGGLLGIRAPLPGANGGNPDGACPLTRAGMLAFFGDPLSVCR